MASEEQVVIVTKPHKGSPFFGSAFAVCLPFITPDVGLDVVRCLKVALGELNLEDLGEAATNHM